MRLAKFTLSLLLRWMDQLLRLTQCNVHIMLNWKQLTVPITLENVGRQFATLLATVSKRDCTCTYIRYTN